MAFRISTKIVALAGLALLAIAGVALASHSWGTYHWARKANPFTLKLGDNVSSVWDPYLGVASTDWSLSSVLDTTIVAGGTNPKNCRATSGRVEVCAAKYGFNGWLGLAQIWLTRDGHIYKGVTKLNDTYFNTATYNKPALRQMVMCQEIGHNFGLDHQDEDFSNPPLGTCMDYTSDPTPNQHPNQHDYDQLETIYAHLDSYTTLSQSVRSARGGVDLPETAEWGRAHRQDGRGRSSLYVKDLGNGEKVLTFVLWTE
ncbi:MAG: hypothetical protein A2939_00160 [Parcubacteria group bacterium RIFCSPLOWO2_01_FULL_48_18]|nr:MAG: hypothetical protein A3J67_05885 [Parcubacteria group bacterium RIFCSPHIGHO2_02_FULL_48_10b]OHB22179.1 MAG: hypothetical protein A2939_00160 [Parcubacteria group bacterium RIFCSPLOWO2_01_FULL_48_18]